MSEILVSSQWIQKSLLKINMCILNSNRKTRSVSPRSGGNSPPYKKKRSVSTQKMKSMVKIVEPKVKKI